jgi:hypothetical protein
VGLPAARDNVIGWRWPRAREPVNCAVQVDITVAAHDGAHSFRPASRPSADCAELDENPRRETAGNSCERGVRGLAQVSQQGGGGFGIGRQQGGECVRIKLPDLGRDVVEGRVPAGQLGPADGAPRRPLAPLAAQGRA